MTTPSEHSRNVSKFVDDRWSEILADLNGDELTPQQVKLTRGVLRALGYVDEDERMRLADHLDAHHVSAWARWRRGKLEPAEVTLIVGVLGGIAALVARLLGFEF